jgi:hypothetical protein
MNVDFNKIDSINIQKGFSESEPPKKQNVVPQKVVSTPTEKTPSNPGYWQGVMGIKTTNIPKSGVATNAKSANAKNEIDNLLREKVGESDV